MSQSGQVESRQEIPKVVLRQEVPEWGRIDPCRTDTRPRRERGAWLDESSRREG